MFSKNDIVVYENQFNTGVALRGFTANQLNILMAIATKMRNKDSEIINFNFTDLRNIIKDSYNLNDIEFEKEILSINKKLLELNFTFKKDYKTIQFALFSYFMTDSQEKTLEVAINSPFRFLLNKLSSEFTEFELVEFVEYKSSYTKEFFRRMKQFRTQGWWNVSIEDFRFYLCIPNSYSVSDIDKRVLAPILEELKEEYNLKVKKIYTKKNKGRPSVSGFKFTFKKEIIKSKSESSDYTVKGLLTLYQSRTLKLFDNNFNRYNYCKILNIELKNNKYILTLKNSDDDFISKLDYFETQEHLQRFINKYMI